MTIQDLIDFCARCKARTHPDGYPLSALLVIDIDDVEHELEIDGCEGHGHEWEEPERIVLMIKGSANEH